MKRKPTVGARQAEKLIRAAYDFEAMSARLRAAGFDSIASGVRAVSSELGDLGRSLERTLGERRRA